MKKKTLILASSSPRRIELLSAVYGKLRVEKPEVDEAPRRGESPQAMVRRLAKAKAHAIAQRLDHDHRTAVIIAADTVVVSIATGRILGKPTNAADAVRMLKQLRGKAHLVYTGYALEEVGGKSVGRVVCSKVFLRKLTDAQIRAYVKSGEPMDKAGSYAAQGMGASFIEKIQGSYSNVVGLPLSQVCEDLEREFGIGIFWKK